MCAEVSEWERKNARTERGAWLDGEVSSAAVPGKQGPTVMSRSAGGAADLDIGVRLGGSSRVDQAGIGQESGRNQAMSNRSRFMTLSQADTKSRTNFSLASSLA
ncbi:hypothetical protein SAMN05216174_107294 [Actinokineospora iranica]|uniref:Uncharacterized protein n=1 Tax=Actinokineospora iranica TaxID=1271860 RepID=A0A1G6S9I6_9PSEU|nr:hypothetical protein SAMN05216174_107294 [Actinokineospora iranica]